MSESPKSILEAHAHVCRCMQAARHVHAAGTQFCATLKLRQALPGGGVDLRSTMTMASFPLLSGLESPADLRRLPLAQLPTLAAELRAYLLHDAATCAEHFTAGPLNSGAAVV